MRLKKGDLVYRKIWKMNVVAPDYDCGFGIIIKTHENCYVDVHWMKVEENKKTGINSNIPFDGSHLLYLDKGRNLLVSVEATGVIGGKTYKLKDNQHGLKEG